MKAIVNKRVLAIFAVSVFLIPILASPALAINDKFNLTLDADNDGVNDLVIRTPTNPKVNKPFNIGIYIADSLVGGETTEDAELYISVTGPGTATGWNDWFIVADPDMEIDDDDDLIGPYQIIDPDPDIIGDEYTITSMDHDYLSKLEYQPGWSGSTIWRVDTAGTYTFILESPDGTFIYSFDITI